MILLRYSDFRAVFGAGQRRDRAGYERWPVENVIYSPVPGMSLVLPRNLTCLQWISVNAGARDTGDREDYDWYLSQRTDDPERHALTLTPLSRSGSVMLTPGPAASVYGVSSAMPVPTPEMGARLFSDVWLYVLRRSTRQIVRGSFLAAANA